MRQLRTGAEHPAREVVLELANLVEAARSALSKTVLKRLYARETEANRSVTGDDSAEVGRYLDLDERVRALMTSLQALEVEKIRRALGALDEWLLHGA